MCLALLFGMRDGNKKTDTDHRRRHDPEQSILTKGKVFMKATIRNDVRGIKTNEAIQ